MTSGPHDQTEVMVGSTPPVDEEPGAVGGKCDPRYSDRRSPEPHVYRATGQTKRTADGRELERVVCTRQACGRVAWREVQ